MSHKKTHEEFISDLKKINPNIHALGLYSSAVTKIQFKCLVCGNEWETIPASLLSGRGCPECGKIKKSTALRKTNEKFLDEMSNINPNIEIIDKYIKKNIKISVKCKICGNEWKANPNDLLHGHGCPKCGLVRQKTGRLRTHEQFLEDLRAINPNIEIINEYINNHTKVQFRCLVCGCVWKTVPNSVLLGHGCPECARSSTSFLEQVIFQAFNCALGEHTVKSRDREFIGKELDIYIPSLNIAFEPGSWAWHKNKLKQDIAKRKMCLDKGVRLITIYTEYKDTTPPFETDCYIYSSSLGYSNMNEVRKLVSNFLKMFNLNLNEKQWESVKQISLEKSRRKTHEEFVQELAQINSDIEVTGHYKNSDSKISFKCRICNCEWRATPNSVLRNSGCPQCGRSRIIAALTKSHNNFITEMTKINPQIKILGKYTNSKSYIACKCLICGNEWETLPNRLLRGSGCPKCGRKRASQANSKTHEQFVIELENVNNTIETVDRYVNSSTKIYVRCKKCDYHWYANPMDILRGHGCPKCAGSLKKTHEQFVAELSAIHPDIEAIERYVNANTKIKFKCRSCGKEWYACPHDILRRGGCSNCSAKKR